MALEQLHEQPGNLSSDTLNMNRALASLIEELEAVAWYRQRADACSNDELKEILLHNAKEEKEHAAMVLEWIRRHDDEFNDELKTYLFTKKPIMEVEEDED
ncbi:MAG: ferritin family protein [Candidatus Kapaibacterium sp.]